LPSDKTKRRAPPGPEEQIAAFIEKFEPKAVELIRRCRAELRRMMPTAFELVYDNYNFFVIGYCSTAKASTCIVSIAAAANGVGLSFYHGASLEDPEHLLQGEGKQNRFVRLPSAEVLRKPGVIALVRAAMHQAKVPLAGSGAGVTVIQSVSAKQRPRRKTPAI
jgi:hypothetical protein